MKIENLNLSAIKYFIDAVEAQSVSRASEKNYVSRPAVSQSIRRLEEWSGKQFISHSKRLFVLTEDGQKFYRFAKVAYENFQKTIDQGTNPHNSLNVGCSASLVNSFVVPAISRHKDIEHFNLKTGTTQQLRELLVSEEINISISISSDIRNKNLSKVIHHGNFVIASLDGKMKDKIIVTEDRLEVIALKKYLGLSAQSKFTKIESWTTGIKIAKTLNMACLIPDILLEKAFKKVSHTFKYEYRVMLEHRPMEYLSDSEVSFIKHFSKS